MKIFSPEATSRLVQELIIPAAEATTTRVVVGTVDEDGAQVVASFKKRPAPGGFSWELQAAARHEWTGDNGIGGKVILQW